MKLTANKNLPAARQKAWAIIDEQAEAARMRFITPGAGQAMEYQATEAEGRKFVANNYQGYSAEEYPFMEAERLAIELATGQPTSPEQIAHIIITQANAWIYAGSEIKRLRREAKIKIEKATSLEEIELYTNVDWPTP